MKKHIIYSLAVLGLSFLALSAQAQGRGQENNTPESKSQKVANHLQAKLGLSDEQRDKIINANLSTIKDTRALKAAKRNDVSGLKEGYSEIHEAYDKSMQTILTGDQYTSWKKLQAEARARKQKEIAEQTGKKGKFNANEEDPEEEMTWEESED